MGYYNGFNFSCLFVITAYFIFFIWKYRGNKKEKLLLLHTIINWRFWTAIPTVVLSVLIFFGLSVWADVTKKPSEDAMVIELYAHQFDWTARYSGSDNILGAAHVSAIHEDIDEPSANNPLGLITKVP